MKELTTRITEALEDLNWWKEYYPQNTDTIADRENLYQTLLDFKKAREKGLE